MGLFDIEVRSRMPLHRDGEPDDFITEHTAVVRYERPRDGRRFRVGKLLAYRIQADLAANAGVRLFEICDCHSQPMADLYAELFDPRQDDLREDIRSHFDGFDSDILVIDYCLLHPRWRGLKLGLVTVRKLVDLLGGGCGMVVADIAPLRHDAEDIIRVPSSWLPRNETPEARKGATRKLRRRYRRMGFERIGRTRYFGLSMARRMPTVEDLLKPGT